MARIIIGMAPVQCPPASVTCLLAEEQISRPKGGMGKGLVSLTLVEKVWQQEQEPEQGQEAGCWHCMCSQEAAEQEQEMVLGYRASRPVPQRLTPSRKTLPPQGSKASQKSSNSW